MEAASRPPTPTVEELAARANIPMELRALFHGMWEKIHDLQGEACEARAAEQRAEATIEALRKQVSDLEAQIMGLKILRVDRELELDRLARLSLTLHDASTTLEKAAREIQRTVC